MRVAKTVRLDGKFVAAAEVHALADHRSVPKQIEHWAWAGKAAEENPDLPYAAIRDLLSATEQMKAGMATPYERPKKAQRS